MGLMISRITITLFPVESVLPEAVVETILEVDPVLAVGEVVEGL